MPSMEVATFSPDRRYRYSLRRRVGLDPGTCVFCMLNPSTADERVDDPTIRRCIGFTRMWGFGILVVVNLFGLRATDPRELYSAADPVGPGNDDILYAQARSADRFIAAWGNHGQFQDRGAQVLALLESFKVPVMHLGLTQKGQPRHPLRLLKTLEAIPLVA